MAATASILGDLFVLFVAAKLAGALVARLGQPAVLGELLAGLLVGPFALGLVGTADPALVAVFHGDAAAAQEALDLVLLAELGVVLLLFFVGLETRLSDSATGSGSWRHRAPGRAKGVSPAAVRRR